ncbi:MAG: DUF6261 family protein [Bacteroidota bacterium]
MIATIDYRKLWVSEFIQFLKDVISICRQNDPAKLNINTRVTLLEEIVNRLDAVFKKEQGSVFTEELVTLDERRDKAFLCLTMLAKAYGYHFDEAKLEAAEKIDALLERYGSSIQKLNYQAETTTLTNFVNDLESDAELALAVNTLDLQSLVDEIKTSNNLFNGKYLARAREMSEAPEESAVELRKPAIRQYRSLVNLIEAHVEISGPDRYQNLIKHLNEVIEGYNKTAAFRERDGETEEEGEAI